MAEYLLWLDVETSGLDPHSDVLLEIAASITTIDLCEAEHGKKAEVSWLIGLPTDLALTHVHPDVLRMHVDSGLWAECQKGGFLPAVAIREMVSWVLRTVPSYSDPLYVAGRSVHFDLDWIHAHGHGEDVNKLVDRLHHRRFDLSSVKMFARLIGIDVEDTVAKHRALPDVQDDIALTRRLWYEARKLDPTSIHHVAPVA